MHLNLLHLHHLGYLPDWVSLRNLLSQHKQHLNKNSLSQQTQLILHLSFRVYSLALVSELQLQRLLRKRILTNLSTFLARLILWPHPPRMVINLRAAPTHFKILIHKEKQAQIHSRWSLLELKKALRLLKLHLNSQMLLVCLAKVQHKVLKSRKQLSKSQQILRLRLILCQELQQQIHKTQAIYLGYRLLQQRLRFLLLHQLRLQSLGEPNLQKLQKLPLTRQLQVYPALVYFPECQLALRHNNQRMTPVNNPKMLPRHLNNNGALLQLKIKKLMFSDNNLQHLIQAFHSSNRLLPNKNLKNNLLHLFLNMDKITKSNNLQMQEDSLQRVCLILCLVWTNKSPILFSRKQQLSSSHRLEKKLSLAQEERIAKVILL